MSDDKKLTLDNWKNVVTGVGITGKDKLTYSEVEWQRTDRSTAEALFAADDLGGKIASMIPFDGTREGITWNFDGDEATDTNEVIKFLNGQFDDLKVWNKLKWAWTMARVYGGALLFVSVDDGQQDLSQPLNIKAVRSIKSLHVIERWSLNVTSIDIISDINSPHFGTPKYYMYNTTDDAGSTMSEYVKIHHSRVIRFDGNRLPTRLYKKNNYWHDSIYSRLNEALRNYSMSESSIPTIIQELNQLVMKIDGLNEAIQMDEQELVVGKLNFVNLLRSSLRAVVLDGNDEFDFKQVAVAGVKDLMDIPRARLIAASSIPHTRLMGESPGASLGEQGRSQLTDYYDFVAAQQKEVLEEPIKRLLEIMAGQVDKPIDIPPSTTFIFNPLYQDDQKTIIETRQIQANIDKIYGDLGVYDAFEIAENRFGSGEYSYETRLSMEEREDREFNQAEVDENIGEENGKEEGEKEEVTEGEGDSEKEDN